MKSIRIACAALLLIASFAAAQSGEIEECAEISGGPVLVVFDPTCAVLDDPLAEDNLADVRGTGECFRFQAPATLTLPGVDGTVVTRNVKIEGLSGVALPVPPIPNNRVLLDSTTFAPVVPAFGAAVVRLRDGAGRTVGEFTSRVSGILFIDPETGYPVHVEETLHTDGELLVNRRWEDYRGGIAFVGDEFGGTAMVSGKLCSTD